MDTAFVRCNSPARFYSGWGLLLTVWVRRGEAAELLPPLGRPCGGDLQQEAEEDPGHGTHTCGTVGHGWAMQGRREKMGSGPGPGGPKSPQQHPRPHRWAGDESTCAGADQVLLGDQPRSHQIQARRPRRVPPAALTASPRAPPSPHQQHPLPFPVPGVSRSKVKLEWRQDSSAT